MSDHIYSLPQVIEIIPTTDDNHGNEKLQDSEIRLEDQIPIGDRKLILWNDIDNANPLAASKSFKKAKRKLQAEICKIFGKRGDILHSIRQGNYEVKTRVRSERQISLIIPKKGSPLVFQPFAFYKNNERSGGAYLNVSHTSNTAQEGESLLVSKKILMGMCLRPNLIAVDKNNNKLDIRLDFVDKQIVSFEIIGGIHVYEATFIEMLRTLLPLCATISRCDKPQVFFHLPLPEYLLHGVSLFLNGRMTEDVLDVYADLYAKYALQLKQKLSKKLGDTKIEVSSPLDALTENPLKSSDSFTQQFFKDLDISIEKLTREDNMEYSVAIVVLKWLKNQCGYAGEAWTIFTERAVVDEGENLNLKTIAAWSNCVFYAMHSSGMKNGEVTVIDDAAERRIIQLFQKYIQSDSFPSLQCFHWLMPMQATSVKSLFHVSVLDSENYLKVNDIEETFNRVSLDSAAHALHYNDI